MREYLTKKDTLLFAKAISSPLRLDIFHYVLRIKVLV